MKLANISALQLVIGIGQLRAHDHATRRGVGGRSDGGDLSLEHVVGDRRDLHLDLLPDTDERNIVLRNSRLEPHGGEIGDGEQRLAGVAADVLARADLARDHRSIDRRAYGDE